MTRTGQSEHWPKRSVSVSQRPPGGPEPGAYRVASQEGKATTRGQEGAMAGGRGGTRRLQRCGPRFKGARVPYPESTHGCMSPLGNSERPAEQLSPKLRLGV